MRHRILLTTAAIVFSGFWAITPGAWADMTFDEFLDYSVQGLQNRMAELNETNRSLRQKTDALRNRILFLRQQMRDLDDKRMRLEEEADHLKVFLKADARRQKILLEQKNQGAEKRDNLLAEGKEIQDIVRRVQARQEELRGQVLKSKDELQNLKAKQIKSPVVPVDPLREQKAHLAKRVTEEASKARNFFVQMQSLQNQLAPLEKDKVTLENENSILQGQVTMAQASLQAVMDAAKVLKQKSQEQRKQEEGILEQQRQEVALLDEDREALDQAIKEFSAMREELLVNVAARTQVLSQIQTSLVEQKEALARQEDQLRDYKDLLLEKKQLSEAKAKSQREQAAVDSKIKTLRGDLDSLIEKIAQEKKRQTDFGQEDRSLKKEIQKLQGEVAQAGKVSVNQDLIARKKTLSREILEQKKKNALVERDVAREKDQSSILQALKEKEMKDAEVLKGQLGGLKQELETLAQGKKDLIASRLPPEEQEATVRQLEEEIKEMDYRKEVLVNSIKLIQSRYENYQAAVSDFRRDESNLNKYRADLLEENKGLREKEQELMATQKNPR